MDEDTTSVVIIGGGPAGYVAAIRGAQHGLDVTLVEREAIGGTCLNFGCIPSKALISATDVAHRAAEASRMGITADPRIDVSQMVRWKDGIVRRLTKGVEHLCDKNGVTLLNGTARFVDDEHVRIDLDEGDDITIAFEYAIVATGSRPIELPFIPFDDPRVYDSRDALAMDDAPDSLAIIGAGYIGMELAGVFAKLGTDVTIVELLENALPRYDDDLTEPILSHAKSLGIDFHFETAVQGLEETPDGLELITDNGREPVRAERVLVAVGREPVTDTLDIDTVGLDLAEDGTIPTDNAGRTGIEGIFAVGDVAGDPMLAHAGMAEGLAAIEAIVGDENVQENRVVPEVVFTDPELAVVGLTAAEAVAEGLDPVVGEFPLRANGRTLTLDRRDGFVRLIAEEETGIVVGGAVVGPEASELIGEIGLAVELGASLEEIGQTIHTHPTLSEAIMEAAEHGRGMAIHRLN